MTLNTVSRFDDRAADYVKYRPGYPAAAIDAILEGLGPPGAIRAADIGAGTGISARLLADRGVRVTAVEPGKTMRGAAAPHAGVTWVSGTAEATTLPDASHELVLAAQSFHWFRAAEALPEFARIAVAGGRLAIMWNRRSKIDPFTAGYRKVLLDVGGEVEAERMPFDPSVVERSGVWAGLERLAFPNAQRLDLDGLIGRARSASYVPKSGDAGARLIERLTALHRQYADATGHVTLVYETELFRARRR